MLRTARHFSFSYLRYPSHVQFYAFSLFVSENSGIFHGEAELRLTPADQVLLQRTVKTQAQTGLVNY